jgi:hypothetical protein
MAVTNEEIVDYHVVFYTGPQGKDGYDARIVLYIPSGQVYLRFYPEGTTLPLNDKTKHPTSKGKFYFNLSYKYSQLSCIIDILRNEKSVRFFFDDAGNRSYVVSSSN